MAVWIRLEQLPIEYYHPEFLKKVGNKLGKILRIDAITNNASRFHFARLCVQLGIKKPLPKRIKIDHFWQDIVYENIPTFYIVYGRLGHKDMQCSETAISEKSNINPTGNSLLVAKPDSLNTPWKRVSTKKTRPRDMTKEDRKSVV